MVIKTPKHLTTTNHGPQWCDMCRLKVSEVLIILELISILVSFLRFSLISNSRAFLVFSFSTHYALQKFFIKSIKLYYHNWLWFLYNKYCLVVMFNQCQNKAIFIIWDLWNILFWDCWNVKAVWVDWFVGWSSSITVSLFVLSCKVRILKRGAKIYVRRL